MDLLEPPCTLPDAGTQCRTLLEAMQRGEKLRPWDAAKKYGVMALSQRIGDLKRRYGWPVQSKTVETDTGKRISEYWMAA